MINMLTLSQLAPLKIIATALARTNVRWAVYASAALALHGLDIAPADLDIITDQDGASKIRELLSAYEVKSFQKTPSDKFESNFMLFIINGINVEVAGNFNINVGNRWVNMSYLLDKLTLIQVDDIKVPVPTLHDMLLVYQMMGREKDLLKVEKIKKILNVTAPKRSLLHENTIPTKFELD